MDLSQFNFRAIHCKFYGYQNQNMNRSSQQYRSWSDCAVVQACLTQNGCQNRSIRSKHIYLHIFVWVVFLFCHMFYIKKI